jgi:hypothetical protein
MSHLETYRWGVCQKCSAPCDQQNNPDWRRAECAECPLLKWHRYGKCVTAPTTPQPVRGLGDLVHAVAMPIARALHLPCVDPQTKKLRPESPCAARRKKMNETVPFTKPISK